jgi:hypothetical protein
MIDGTWQYCKEQRFLMKIDPSLESGPKSVSQSSFLEAIMSMQLLAKEKVKKAPSCPPSRASNNGEHQGLMMQRPRSPVTELNIGERLREGVQKRLKEHASRRQAANANKTMEDALDLSSENEESPVNPRRVHCGNPCRQDYCEQQQLASDIYEGKVYNVEPNYGEPYQLIASSDLFAHWYANLPTTDKVRTEDTDDDDEDDDDEEQEFEGLVEAGAGIPIGECEKVYKKHGNSVSHLLVMSLGLSTADGRKLADFDDDDNYKTYLPKSLMPKVPLMKWEMKRRATAAGITKFRKSSVLKPEALHWLRSNPVSNQQDVQFLTRTEDELYKTMLEAKKEIEEADREKLATSNWTGNAPWCRLYCAMTHDDALEAIKYKDNVMQRDELDARNSENRPASYEAIVAKLYNDPTEEFYTEAVPALHDYFAEPICLEFLGMPGGEISAEDVKKKIGDARAKLMQVGHRTVRKCRKDILCQWLNCMDKPMLMVASSLFSACTCR